MGQKNYNKMSSRCHQEHLPDSNIEPVECKPQLEYRCFITVKIGCKYCMHASKTLTELKLCMAVVFGVVITCCNGRV